ncbi:FtsK/SpoIIIE domain-containing protein [Leucobacter sp. HY1910]
MHDNTHPAAESSLLHLGRAGGHNDPVSYRLDGHLAIQGGAGSGKTELLRNVLLGAALRQHPIVVIDPVMGGKGLTSLLPAVSALAGTPGGAAEVAEALVRELERREEQPDVQHVPIIVAVDNLWAAVAQEEVHPDDTDEKRQLTEAKNNLRRRLSLALGDLAALGDLGANIFLVVASQEFGDHENSTDDRVRDALDVRNYARTRVLLGRNTRAQVNEFLGGSDSDADMLKFPTGTGVLLDFDYSAETVRTFQAPSVLSKEAVAAALALAPEPKKIELP